MGLAPVQREGVEYEFTVFMDVDQGHYTRVSKDRTNMFQNEVFLLDESAGKRLLEWLNSGADAPLDHMAQKRLVIQQMQKLGIPLETNADGKVEKVTYEKVVKEQTQLDLTDENLPDIIDRLAILIQERAAAGTEWTDMRQTAQSQPEQDAAVVEPDARPEEPQEELIPEEALPVEAETEDVSPKRRARKAVAV